MAPSLFIEDISNTQSRVTAPSTAICPVDLFYSIIGDDDISNIEQLSCVLKNRRSARNPKSFDLLCYSGVTSAEKVEKLDLDIRTMHDQT